MPVLLPSPYSLPLTLLLPLPFPFGLPLPLLLPLICATNVLSYWELLLPWVTLLLVAMLTPEFALVVTIVLVSPRSAEEAMRSTMQQVSIFLHNFAVFVTVLHLFPPSLPSSSPSLYRI